MKTKQYDLVIVGGGIMGLMTAYYASKFTQKILILEKNTIGNTEAASSGKTRSIRQDYLDPHYATMAYESRLLWDNLEKASNKPLICYAGCLNIAKKSLSPNLDESYALKSYKMLTKLGYETKRFDQHLLYKAYPQFDVDIATLDVKAGFLNVANITEFILKTLQKNKITILESTDIKQIVQCGNQYTLITNDMALNATKVILAPGRWINQTLQTVKGCTLTFPIYTDKPQECQYWIPKTSKRANYIHNTLPVFAYLDYGIYGHPIYPGVTQGVKIGCYNPPGLNAKNKSTLDIQSFVRRCMPGLRSADMKPVTDTDQCSYTMVKDNDFIVGKIEGWKNLYVATGWCGTGYKFAPLIGSILSNLCFYNQSKYDISRWNPNRFTPSPTTRRAVMQ